MELSRNLGVGVGSGIVGAVGNADGVANDTAAIEGEAAEVRIIPYVEVTKAATAMPMPSPPPPDYRASEEGGGRVHVVSAEAAATARDSLLHSRRRRRRPERERPTVRPTALLKHGRKLDASSSSSSSPTAAAAADYNVSSLPPCRAASAALAAAAARCKSVRSSVRLPTERGGRRAAAETVE